MKRSIGIFVFLAVATRCCQGSLCSTWCADGGTDAFGLCSFVCGDRSNQTEQIIRLSAELRQSKLQVEIAEETIAAQAKEVKEKERALKLKVDLIEDARSSGARKIIDLRTRLEDCEESRAKELVVVPASCPVGVWEAKLRRCARRVRVLKSQRWKIALIGLVTSGVLIAVCISAYF